MSYSWGLIALLVTSYSSGLHAVWLKTDLMNFRASQIHQETVVEGRWGRKGSPWELNLRDVFRWCDLLIKHQV